jgi:hypothetical protein
VQGCGLDSCGSGYRVYQWVITQAYNIFIVWSILCLLYQFPHAEFENHAQIYASHNSFLTKLNCYFYEHYSHEPKVRTIACALSVVNNVCFFSLLLLIFFILLINYTIFYCILLLCIYDYHNFLAPLYKFLMWYKKVNFIF